MGSACRAVRSVWRVLLPEDAGPIFFLGTLVYRKDTVLWGFIFILHGESWYGTENYSLEI